MITLFELLYLPDSLEPAISAGTIGFHHGKHLAALWGIADWDALESRYLDK